MRAAIKPKVFHRSACPATNERRKMERKNSMKRSPVASFEMLARGVRIEAWSTRKAMTEAAMDSDDGNPDQKQTKKLVSGAIIVPLPNGDRVEAIARKKDYLIRIIRLYDSSSRLNFNSEGSGLHVEGSDVV